MCAHAVSSGAELVLLVGPQASLPLRFSTVVAAAVLSVFADNGTCHSAFLWSQEYFEVNVCSFFCTVLCAFAVLLSTFAFTPH